LSTKKDVSYYLGLSIIGAVLLVLVTYFSSSDVNIALIDKLIIGGAFVTSCLFGISLALRPGWTGRYSKERVHGLLPEKPLEPQRKRRGHHPECTRFDSHRISTKRKTYCAGCLGLALGSFISIILMILYVIAPYEFSDLVLNFLIIIGLIIIAVAYVEIMIPKRRAYVHVVSNILLVLGFLFIIIGLFELTGSVFIGIIGVIFSFLWLDTRIQLSSWRHVVICKNCNESCKAY
jgi:hypothetical protein